MKHLRNGLRFSVPVHGYMALLVLLLLLADSAVLLHPSPAEGQDLQGSPATERGEPDLSAISEQDEKWIQEICHRQISLGPATYYHCLRSQRAALPDLSAISERDEKWIREMCDGQISLGPATYYRCLRSERDALLHLGDDSALPAPPATGILPPRGATGEPSPGTPPSVFALPSPSAGAEPSLPPPKRQTLPPPEVATVESPQGTPPPLSPPSPATPGPVPAPTAPPADFGALGFLLLMLLAGVGWYLWKHRRGPRLAGYQEFETFVTSLFERDGYEVVQRGGAGDERIDLGLNLRGVKDVVQCKRWKNDIGSATVKEFYGSMLRAGARHGFILTTASFSRGAMAFALGKPITLIDGTYLASWASGSKSSRSSAEEKRRSGDGFDPYDVLEVSREARQEEIREAYVRLVAKHHPDKVRHLGKQFQQIAHEKMLAINRAYTVLTSRPT